MVILVFVVVALSWVRSLRVESECVESADEAEMLETTEETIERSTIAEPINTWPNSSSKNSKCPETNMLALELEGCMGGWGTGLTFLRQRVQLWLLIAHPIKIGPMQISPIV